MIVYVYVRGARKKLETTLTCILITFSILYHSVSVVIFLGGQLLSRRKYVCICEPDIIIAITAFTQYLRNQKYFQWIITSFKSIVYIVNICYEMHYDRNFFHWIEKINIQCTLYHENIWSDMWILYKTFRIHFSRKVKYFLQISAKCKI